MCVAAAGPPRPAGAPPGWRQIIINSGALPCLLNLLTTSHKKSIKKEACWTISNITAGTKEQIQARVGLGGGGGRGRRGSARGCRRAVHAGRPRPAPRPPPPPTRLPPAPFVPPCRQLWTQALCRRWCTCWPPLSLT